MEKEVIQVELWFDVGFKRYTTCEKYLKRAKGCGLM